MVRARSLAASALRDSMEKTARLEVCPSKLCVIPSCWMFTGVATVYTGEKYTGKSQYLAESVMYDWCKGNFTIGNDVVHSVKVKSGYEVILFEHCHGGKGLWGKKEVLKVDTPKLMVLPAQASGATVRKIKAPAKAILYTDPGYKGKKQSLQEGVYNFCKGTLTIGNDVVSSVKVTPGYEMTFFEHCHASNDPWGIREEVDKDTPELKVLKKKVSGCIVQKKKPDLCAAIKCLDHGFFF